jgi:Spy/CpxP family protein refolding chaperone
MRVFGLRTEDCFVLAGRRYSRRDAAVKKLARAGMKLVVCGMMLSALFAGHSLLAQDPGGPPPPDGMEGAPQGAPPPMNVDRMLARMTKRYGLTDAETAKIRPILEDAKSRQDALRKDSSMTPEEQFQASQSIRADETQKIADVLTDEQRAKYLADEKKANRRSDGDDGGEPPPPPDGGGGPPPDGGGGPPSGGSAGGM